MLMSLSLTFSLPAATTGVMPESLSAWMARFVARLKEPPKDMFTTALPFRLFFLTSSMTNCKPFRMFEFLPDPLASRTLTPLMFAFLATPNVAPATVPDTWLP